MYILFFGAPSQQMPADDISDRGTDSDGDLDDAVDSDLNESSSLTKATSVEELGLVHVSDVIQCIEALFCSPLRLHRQRDKHSCCSALRVAVACLGSLR